MKKATNRNSHLFRPAWIFVERVLEDRLRPSFSIEADRRAWAQDAVRRADRCQRHPCFLFLDGICKADGFDEACRCAAGSAGAAEQDAAALDEGHFATAVASGCGVHAGHDHASRTGGGNDCADCVAYGK